MKSKKIANIVFYKFYSEDGARKQACIFYNDGTVRSCSYEDGIDAVVEMAKEEKITSKDELSQLINNKFVHVMSGYDFEKKFQDFIVKEKKSEENKDVVLEKPKSVESRSENKHEVKDESLNNFDSKVLPIPTVKGDKISNKDNKPVQTYKDLAKTDYEKENDNKNSKDAKSSTSNVVSPIPSKSNSDKKKETKKSPLKAANEVYSKGKKKKDNFFGKVKFLP